MRVAYLASAAALAGAEIDEANEQIQQLTVAFRQEGMELVPVRWDAVDPTGFDVALVGPTWDYWEHPEAFVAALEALPMPVHNPAEVVRWNIDKHYLQDLAAAGLPTIPTLWREAGAPLDGVYDILGADRVVIKRAIGAGAYGQHRVRRGEPLPQVDGTVLVQAYLPSIERRGELSLVYIGGTLSHAVLKTPEAGDYRIQMHYGGVDRGIEPSVQEREVGTSVLDALRTRFGTVPLVVRVDLVWDEEDELTVIEVELIEPYLYAREAPHLGRSLACALRERTC